MILDMQGGFRTEERGGVEMKVDKLPNFMNSRFEVHEKFHRCDIAHSNPIYI